MYFLFLNFFGLVDTTPEGTYGRKILPLLSLRRTKRRKMPVEASPCVKLRTQEHLSMGEGAAPALTHPCRTEGSRGHPLTPPPTGHI